MCQSRGHLYRISMTPSLMVDAILYDLGPRLASRGADVWIEDVDEDHVVLGYRCHTDRHEQLWNWLCHRLQDLLVNAEPCWVELLDRSQTSFSAGVVGQPARRPIGSAAAPVAGGLPR